MALIETARDVRDGKKTMDEVPLKLRAHVRRLLDTPDILRESKPPLPSRSMRPNKLRKTRSL